MQIAFLFPEKSKYSSYYGGPVERWVYEVSSRMEKDGLNIEILSKTCNTKHAYDQSVERNKFDQLYKVVTGIPGVKINSGIANYTWILGFWKNIRRTDVLIVENRLYFAPIIRKLGYKGKLYVHVHNDLLKKYGSEYLNKINKAVDGLILCSAEISGDVQNKCPELWEKTSVIYNGCNPKIFKPVDQNNNEQYILYVGRLLRQKGVHVLLRAFLKLSEEFPQLKLKIAGSSQFGGDANLSPYELELKQFIYGNQLGDKIEMLGYVDHDSELPELFSNATILCLPSLISEAFPMVVVEAMFTGTVVVASRLGGIEEALGSAQMLVESGNVEDLYGKLREVLLNDKLKEEVSTRNISRALSKYTWEIIYKDAFAFVNTIEAK